MTLLDRLIELVKGAPLTPQIIASQLPIAFDHSLTTIGQKTDSFCMSGKFGKNGKAQIAAWRGPPQYLALGLEPSVPFDNEAAVRAGFQVQKSKFVKGDGYALIRRSEGIETCIIVDDTGRGITLLSARVI